MDRRAIARAGRRRQVVEALQFEQARAAALREQLESIVVELEGPQVDEAVFARMHPEEVEVVRPAVQAPELEAIEEEWLLTAADDLVPEPAEEREAEIARLKEEIEGSRRRQRAFERYLEELAD